MNTLKNQEKTNIDLFFFAVLWALLDPVLGPIRGSTIFSDELVWAKTGGIQRACKSTPLTMRRSTNGFASVLVPHGIRNPMATGPLTQATGPPRSGAGVGVGMLRGAGDPFLEFLLDLEIHQDSTIVKLGFIRKNLGEADRFGPTQNAKIFPNIPEMFKNMFGL